MQVSRCNPIQRTTGRCVSGTAPIVFPATVKDKRFTLATQCAANSGPEKVGGYNWTRGRGRVFGRSKTARTSNTTLPIQYGSIVAPTETGLSPSSVPDLLTWHLP